MKRTLLIIWCVGSLGIAFAAVVGWARGLISSESALASYDDRRFMWVSHDGVMVFLYARVLFENESAEADWRAWSGQDKDSPHWRTSWQKDVTNAPAPEKTYMNFGAEYTTTQMFRRISTSGRLWWHRVIIQVPYWGVLLLTAVPALCWIAFRERSKHVRQKKGLCQSCGFDLGEVYHFCPKCGERAPLPESMMAFKT